MTEECIAQQRLTNQQIAGPTFARPSDVVAWLGAVQAQDYLGALWAVGLRTSGATEQTVEQALADKTIVRTWPMRGTIHFVAPADVRWMLELLAPRVVRRMAARRAELGIDEAVVAASARIIAGALEGGRQLARSAIYELLEQANIATASSRGLHILGRLAHDRLICFGAREGKQPTFALLEEWAPGARSLPPDEALATLALRYFTSHGPASVADFMWWSGLTKAEAQAGLVDAAPQLNRECIDGLDYYGPQHSPPEPAGFNTFLLPPFDEFLVAYRDRSAVIDAQHLRVVVPGGNGIFHPIVVIDGRVVGVWKRSIKRDQVVLTFSPFEAGPDEQAVAAAAERYGHFLGKAATVT